jgi:hypothetical protein
MDEPDREPETVPDPLRPPASAPRVLLLLSLGCTASVLLALISALLGKGVPPLYVLFVPLALVVAWLIARR